MFLGDLQEDFGGACGLAVALLPVLEGAHADAHHLGKLWLGNTKFVPQVGNAIACELGSAGRLCLTFFDGLHFFDAGHQILE